MVLAYFKTLFGDAEPAKDPYGAPGTGKSTMISIVTIIGILLAWWLATQFELVRPLFVPSPELVFAKFINISCWNHYSESFLVFVGSLYVVARPWAEKHAMEGSVAGVRSIVSTPAGDRIVLTGENCTARIYDLNSGKEQNNARQKGHTAQTGNMRE